MTILARAYAMRSYGDCLRASAMTTARVRSGDMAWPSAQARAKAASPRAVRAVARAAS